jgi:hypothetical protein
VVLRAYTDSVIAEPLTVVKTRVVPSWAVQSLSPIWIAELSAVAVMVVVAVPVVGLSTDAIAVAPGPPWSLHWVTVKPYMLTLLVVASDTVTPVAVAVTAQVQMTTRPWLPGLVPVPSVPDTARCVQVPVPVQVGTGAGPVPDGTKAFSY